MGIKQNKFTKIKIYGNYFKLSIRKRPFIFKGEPMVYPFDFLSSNFMEQYFDLKNATTKILVGFKQEQ